MSWNDIIGQGRVKELLRAALTARRVAHAYLFSGPEGSGTSAMAIELAKVLNCEKQQEDACGTCPSCLKFRTLQHPNLHLVVPLPVGKNEKQGDDPLAKLSDDDVALLRVELRRLGENPYHHISLPRANNIKINSVREMRKESSFSMFDRGRRVFVVLEAERMTDEAANALLKTLEEPHEDSVIILTTSAPDQLLATIASRCQHLRFGPLGEGEIADALAGGREVPRNEALMIARLANGSYTRALELAESAVGEQYDEALSYLRTVLYRPPGEILSEVDRIARERERPEITNALVLLQSWLRETMLSARGASGGGDGPERETIERFLRRHPDVPYDEVFGQIDTAISLVAKNVYIPLILITLGLELRRSIADRAQTPHTSIQPEG